MLVDQNKQHPIQNQYSEIVHSSSKTWSKVKLDQNVQIITSFSMHMFFPILLTYGLNIYDTTTRFNNDLVEQTLEACSSCVLWTLDYRHSLLLDASSKKQAITLTIHNIFLQDRRPTALAYKIVLLNSCLLITIKYKLW